MHRSEPEIPNPRHFEIRRSKILLESPLIRPTFHIMLNKTLVALFAVWLAVAAHTWYQVAYPETCPHAPGSVGYRACFEPLIGASDQVDIHIYSGVGDKPGLRPIWSAYRHPVSAMIAANFTVPTPHIVRTHDAQLYLWMVVEGGNKTVHETVMVDDPADPALAAEVEVGAGGAVAAAAAPKKRPRQKQIRRLRSEYDPAKRVVVKHAITTLRVPVVSETRNLLDPSATASAAVQGKATLPGLPMQHWRYGRHPLTVRFVGFGSQALYRHRIEAINLSLHTRALPVEGQGGAQQNAYEPLLYVDDLSVRRGHLQVMSNNVTWPDPRLYLKFTPTSVTMHVYKSTMQHVLDMSGPFLGENEQEELRYWMSDYRRTMYLLTQLITMVHLLLEYLAFRDDWMFFVGRKSFSGGSSSSATFSVVRSVVIFLYLHDADTSAIVLFTIGKDILWNAYKLVKVTKPRLVWAGGLSLPSLAYLETSQMTEEEAVIVGYDRYAMLNISMAIYPLVAGLAVYSLVYYNYSSWWSWLIGSLADSVYFFGFISMCPQLYINYKLQSVAHLPMGAFGYKIFNTFIDDVFAFMVKMPLKHKIMTLRDDVVFLGFVYQWWLYRKDASRVNEFGFKYDDVATPEIEGGVEVVKAITEGEISAAIAASEPAAATEAEAEAEKAHAD